MARILLVEDDPRIARPLGRELVRELHTFDLAEDGETGWSFLASGDYDLAILDIMLPRLNGIELCRRLRAPIWSTTCCYWPRLAGARICKSSPRY